MVRSSESHYDTAQICLNGHVVNDATNSHPHNNRAHCEICGAASITQCPNCTKEVPGSQVVGFNVFPMRRRPMYCHECGHPYPWTETAIKAAKELAEELALSDEQKDLLKASIDELIQDTPGAQVASVRFNKLVAKGGKAVADAFRNILIDVVSESVKKSIWP
ncbi:MAG: DUF2321 domain-containing protein [Proteobacteria bacterium]|nr:DUF2321 domain-containing protein [Pseudomonadota bacterium]